MRTYEHLYVKAAEVWFKFIKEHMPAAQVNGKATCFRTARLKILLHILLGMPVCQKIQTVKVIQQNDWWQYYQKWDFLAYSVTCLWQLDIINLFADYYTKDSNEIAIMHNRPHLNVAGSKTAMTVPLDIVLPSKCYCIWFKARLDQQCAVHSGILKVGLNHCTAHVQSIIVHWKQG